ncbi:allergen Tha p 1-like isoform X2 [Pectinophora gossypiella]|uniref:Chemosensory protein n=1 Tax=Pectinophora gossypiella TaxID=13191 RepID=A0A1E1WSQ3_PECGO|nr:allergen Tha p 1-like isoform X1 [Pectinophora gossypiella]XP_049877107.1 allergen Tha p 1-like isoform X2 [Pectinophora gossypiella]
MMSMRYLVLLCCVVAAVVADDKYTDKYDNINVKEILENKRLLQAYVDCILDKGKCTNEGKELKDHLKEALETGCEKCTESQKNGTHTVIQHLIKHEIEIWKELCAKFDPSGTYRKKYEAIAKEHGIEIPE